ncbi:hypothetical protein pdam_00016667, partial [Pocillopora damicornis]
ASISPYASNIVHNLMSDSDLRVRKCQYPPHKNRRRKVEREVNLKMAEEIKVGGESSWWQELRQVYSADQLAQFGGSSHQKPPS